MNTLIKVTHKCSWEEIEARITYDMEDHAGKFITNYSLFKESENSLIWLADVLNYKELKKMMNSPEEKALDKEMGVKYQFYSLEPLDV